MVAVQTASALLGSLPCRAPASGLVSYYSSGAGGQRRDGLMKTKRALSVLSLRLEDGGGNGSRRPCLTLGLCIKATYSSSVVTHIIRYTKTHTKCLLRFSTTHSELCQTNLSQSVSK